MTETKGKYSLPPAEHLTTDQYEWIDLCVDRLLLTASYLKRAGGLARTDADVKRAIGSSLTSIEQLGLVVKILTGTDDVVPPTKP